jgi:hypothetical protein
MKKMPRGDGTGPRGLGSMTGRAAGYCAGYSTPGFANSYGGRMGMGRGYGRGFGFGYANQVPYYNPPVYGGSYYQPSIEPKQEIGALSNEANMLKEQLEAINKRIAELEKTKSN